MCLHEPYDEMEVKLIAKRKGIDESADATTSLRSGIKIPPVHRCWKC
jgi:hypothetical protein